MSKTILITGSTDGIGKMTAIQLAKEGHTVYLHGRNPQKLDAALSEVASKTGLTDVKGFLADFSDLDSVKVLATEIKDQLPKLDVLINNAGVFNNPVSQDKNGIDIRFTVNYLAPVLLTQELLPLLEKSPNSRIVNLGSAAQAPVRLSDITGNHNLMAQQAYSQSKLALTMWTFHIAKKLKGTTAMVVNPGSLLDTKMAKEAFGQVWSPAQKGVDILRGLAVSNDFVGITGQYFDNDIGKLGQAHAEAYNPEKIKELLAFTKKVLPY